MIDLTMSSSFRFLSLPPELRHMIYIEYVYIDGGYVLDSPSWKLRSAGGPEHQFALQGTCKFIHEEMQGLALRHNTITFSALWSWWESVQASRWQRLMCTGPMTAFDLQIMMVWFKRETIDDDMRERVARDYPCFLPHLDWLRGPHPPIPAKGNDDDREKIFNQLGERPSLFRSYLWDILGPHPNDYCRDFPWAILPASELDKLASDLEKKYRNRFSEGLSRTKEYWEVPSDDQRWNYRFSAAAYAIEFLRRHPSIRRHMRKIILNENYVSVAFPECHGKGLIEFCEENPSLRIERRVDLFPTVFSRPAGPRSSDTSDPLQSPTDPTSAISLWISEALALPPAISLVFSGRPIRMFAEWIFEQRVIPDARSRHALEVACARGMFRAPRPMREYPQLEPLEPGAKGSHFHRGVADAIREMVENQSSETGQIRCDFDLGPSWDVEEIIRERSGWTRKEWRKSGNWKTFIDHCGCREILDYEMVSLYDIPEEAYL